MKQHSVHSIPLPANSALQARISKGDFVDCYAASSMMNARQAAEIATNFPSWARGLVALRGVITAPFGLQNEAPKSTDTIGIFPVESETITEDGSEIIAGFNDKHLDFRISVLQHQGQISMATWVHPHNIGGRIYLAMIMPFHIMIARNGVYRVAKAG